MCGIAGWFGDLNGRDEQSVLAEMLQAIRHRGPDGQGTWVGDGVGMAHARLAIIDLNQRATQPMKSQDGRFTLIFNGEIYNYRELARELEAKGVTLRTSSDTEVLVELWRNQGSQCIEKLRGMYAFAIWDSEARIGTLVRDVMGIKPLYYCDGGRNLVFASEQRSLKLGVGYTPALDGDALAGFFAFGTVAEPDMLLKGVRMVPPGALVQFSDGKVAVQQVLSLPRATASHTDDAVFRVREALLDSVKAHLVADVPLGIFLSAGMDSTALLALAAESTDVTRLTAFTIGVDDPQFNESGLASETAERFGVSHQVLRVDMKAAKDVLPTYWESMDSPSIDGFNTFVVSLLARSAGAKVVLSGLGGDELFGGYPSFRSVPRLASVASKLSAVPGTPEIFNKMSALVGGSKWARVAQLVSSRKVGVGQAYAAFRGVYPAHEAMRLAAHFSGQDLSSITSPWLSSALQPPPFSDLRHAVAWLEVRRYMLNQLLRDSDVMSMAHGLELRVPLVDARLYRAVAEVSPHKLFEPGKKLLGDAVPEIGSRVKGCPKRGFRFPFEKWRREGLLGELPKGLPVQPEEWYQQWSVLTLVNWAAKF